MGASARNVSVTRSARKKGSSKAAVAKNLEAPREEEEEAAKEAYPDVLAFGDALTTGLLSSAPAAAAGKPRRAPYTETLQELLERQQAWQEDALLAGPSCASNCVVDASAGFDGSVVVNAGWAGEKAEDMPARLRRLLKQPRDRPFSYVVILAGSVDLLLGTQAEAIWRSLTLLHKEVRRAKASCVAVTIPPIQGEAGIQAEDRRQRVNTALRAEAASAASGRSPQLALADLDAALPEASSEELASFYSDSMYLNTEGYRLFGEVVFAALAPLPGTGRQSLRHFDEHAGCLCC
eukprot:TRINITY_DN120839_c0_g1_i1.p1 TRINITY_DN120839_c0_g1~~TRINITY_DN120839_c0_g1_i1.p1  ORF type:complete len:293 (+),score=81.24 TRINITY_DN120839_c0_g1_i1:136-1014(+)